MVTGLLIIGLGLVWLLPSSAFALTPSEFGGNNASDYQPPTGNPQNNVPSSLQPTNSALQPVTTLNQQALVQSGGLSVSTAAGGGTTSIYSAPAPVKSTSSLPMWIIGSLLLLTAMGYIVLKSETKQEQSEIVTPTPQPEGIETNQKTPKPAKKTTRKKRKSSHT